MKISILAPSGRQICTIGLVDGCKISTYVVQEANKMEDRDSFGSPPVQRGVFAYLDIVLYTNFVPCLSFMAHICWTALDELRTCF